jgi:hypothetical protein
VTCNYDEMYKKGLNLNRSSVTISQGDVRQKKLDTLSSIIESLRRRKALGRELELILTLNNEGHSPGEITEILWYRYGLPRTPFSIYRILGRNEDSKQ